MPAKERVSYFYDSDVGSKHYGANHPMKPHRMVMAHHLVMAYDLHKRMEIYVRRRGDAAQRRRLFR